MSKTSIEEVKKCLNCNEKMNITDWILEGMCNKCNSAYKKGIAEGKAEALKELRNKHNPKCEACGNELTTYFSEDFAGSNEGTGGYECKFCDAKKEANKEFLEVLDKHINELKQYAPFGENERRMQECAISELELFKKKIAQLTGKEEK